MSNETTCVTKQQNNKLQTLETLAATHTLRQRLTLHPLSPLSLLSLDTHHHKDTAMVTDNWCDKRLSRDSLHTPTPTHTHTHSHTHTHPQPHTDRAIGTHRQRHSYTRSDMEKGLARVSLSTLSTHVLLCLAVSCCVYYSVRDSLVSLCPHYLHMSCSALSTHVLLCRAVCLAVCVAV